MGRDDDDDRSKKHRHRSHRHGSKDDVDDDEDDSKKDLNERKDRRRHHKKDHKKRQKEESHRSKRRDKESLNGNEDSLNRDEERRRRRKKHRRDDSSRSEDEDQRRSSKRGRKSEERDHKKKKSKRKNRSSDRDDSSDNEKRHRKSKRSSSRAVAEQKPNKATLYPMGSPVGRSPDTLIHPETDYFTYHQEFWVYLYREEGVRFNDLTSEEAREAFERFSKQYNAGKLELPYYDNPPTFPPQVLDESKTTQHKWSFQTTETERKGLEQLQEGVRRLTQYKDDGKAESSSKTAGTGKGPSQMPDANEADEDRRPRQTPEERVEERRNNRRLREHVRTAQEEITGGAKDLRERQIEKRKEHASRIHGANRDKEEGAGGVELNDAAVYGDDGGSSFQATLARQRQSKARREEERSARVEELKNKERERQENMLKMLGLDAVKPGQKISIAPRKDG